MSTTTLSPSSLPLFVRWASRPQPGGISLDSLNPALLGDHALPNPLVAAAFAAYCRARLQDLAKAGEITAEDLDLPTPPENLTGHIAALSDTTARALLEALELRATEFT